MEVKKSGATTRKVYYFGAYEKHVEGNTVRHIYQIQGPNGLVAIYKKEGGSGEMYYVHTDHLGSVHTVTGQDKTVKGRYYYDAWGNRKEQSLDGSGFGSTENLPWLHRGYTGHEHIEEVNLINMNGRMYDPVLGRFLSPDPYIQAPDMPVNFNRYAYCLNNPLIYTDPSGEIIFTIIGALLAPVTGGASLGIGIAMDIGGAVNLGSQALMGNVNSFGDGLAAYGIGAAAGAVGGAVGAGISSALSVGGSFGAGVLSYVTGVEAAGVLTTSFLTGAAIGAGTGAAAGFISGTGNGLLQGESFGQSLGSGLKTAGWGALSGGLIGGIGGGIDAARDGRDFWSGADQVVFSDVKNRGAGQINCMAKSFEDMYGNTETYWDTYTNSGDEFHTMQNIRNGGGNVMKYPGNDPHVTYNEISNLNQGGGRAMITLDNYRGSGIGHAMAVKKILYVPGKRFDVVVFDPYNGSRTVIRNFTQGTILGQNLRFWHINL
jgi:RHS repeat-associated protein